MLKEWLFAVQWQMWVGTKRAMLGMMPPRAKNVLDIGSGEGDFTRNVADKLKMAEVMGLEIDSRAADVAMKKNGIKTIIADANSPLPFKDGSFDLVVASQIIEHVYDTDLFVSEIYRVLKPNGVCVCSTPNLASIHNIVSLMFGYQPFTCHVSDVAELGGLFSCYSDKLYGYEGKKHRRIFTAPALKQFFEMYKFKVEEMQGYGYYFLPEFIYRKFTYPRYAAYITIRVRK